MSNSIISSFKSLNVTTAQDYCDHDAIYQTSYQYLAKVKEFRDIKAVHNVIVSLINTDRYYKALDILKQVPEDILREFPLEKAYIYYKTGNFQAVEEIYKNRVDSSELSDILKTALKHVMAQCYYQNGKMLEALQLYHQLFALSHMENELDVACNERAIISLLPGRSRTTGTLISVEESDKSYDLVFNEALIELQQNNTAKSVALMKKASDLCTDQNFDSSPDELASELAPIQLALAYVYQIAGNPSQAISTLQAMDMGRVNDLLLNQILKGNLVSLASSPENLNYIARELNYKDVLHSYRNKMTRHQFRSLVKNHLLLSYQSNTLSLSSNYCRNSFLEEFSKEFDGDFFPYIIRLLMRLDISVRDLKTESSYKPVSKKLYKYALSELLKEDISADLVTAALLLLFVNAKSSKFDQAISIIEQITQRELKQITSTVHASLFGGLIGLYEATKSYKKIASFYSSLIESLKILTAEDLQNTHLYEFVRSLLFKLLSINSTFEIRSILEVVQKARPEDLAVKMVLKGDAVSFGNELSSQDNVEDLLNVNVDELIAQFPQVILQTRKEKSTSCKVSKRPRKPKFSKSKVIKPDNDFNVEKDLDQERWLPMKLRTYYKPSKKDLKKKFSGHQGAIELSPAPSGCQSAASKGKQKRKKGKK